MKSPTADLHSQFFTFENNQPRYKICCGRMHVWRTAQVICILEFLGTVALIVTLIISFFVDIFDFPVSTKEIFISWCILAVGASIFYIFGMKKLNYTLMIPRLVVEIISIIVDVMLIGYASSLIAKSGKFNADDVNPDDDTVANHVFLTVWIIILILQLFFFVVLYMAYRFVRDWTVYITYR